MKFEPPLHEARLVRRYKRFLADLERPDGSLLTVHCPNTGAMHGCLAPGAPAFYSWKDDGRRKYPGTLEQTTAVSGHRVGVHSARANALFAEALGTLDGFRGWQLQQAEARYVYTRSRADFLVLRPTSAGAMQRLWVEVKSVTLLLGDGLGGFPDTVSARATRHMAALTEVVRAGDAALLVWLVQHNGIDRVTPADDFDPAYGAAVRDAVAAGVEVMALRTRQRRDGIQLLGPAPVLL